MTESKEDDDMMSQAQDSDVIAASKIEQLKPVINIVKKRWAEEERRVKDIQNEECDDGIKRKKESSGGRYFGEVTEKLQFWDEIRKQVESGENKEDHWKRAIFWRAFQFWPVDQNIFKYLVYHGADIYSTNEEGKTVLCIVTKSGSLDLVKYLVKYGPEHNFQDDYTALLSAIQSGSLGIVKYFVEECRADINCKDEFGKTVLHHAVDAGVTDIVKYLVERGADVNGWVNFFGSVLHAAISRDKLEIVKYLVENGADVNGKDTVECAVLDKAVSKGHLAMVKYLVEKGASVNSEDSYGWTALHTAVTEGSLEIVVYLVKKGADLTGKDADGRTVLHYAVTKGDLEMVKCLVELDANLNGKKTDWGTALHYAVTKDALEMVRYLVEMGADVNCKDTNGWTVLHYAITKNTIEVIKYLIEQGADVNGKDTDGWTVLHGAVRAGVLDIVEFLVEQGANVNGESAYGWSVLHAAIDARALEIVLYLIEQGADITLESKIGVHTLGIDVLMMGIVKNSCILVNFLLDKNVEVWRAGTFFVDGRQMSPLELSIYLGRDEISTILKRSVKHRKNIELLQNMNLNQLMLIEIPMQAFIAKNQFKIGDGGFSSVYLGVMKDGSEVAVKRILVQSEDKTVENEKEIMSLIEADKSPFIVNYRHFHRDDTFMYLIIDLCEENLREYVDACSIELLQLHGPRMTKEILSGLEFLHSKGILHRDLKPSNVLVDIEGRMKLADFGISRVLNDDETTVETFAKGTSGWMPPEVIRAIDKDEKGPFKKKSDVHVAGIVAFFILTKSEHPFGSKFDRMRNILDGNSVSLKKLCDVRAQNFVSWLTNYKIDDRPYAHEALRDPFVNED
ncbi:uncharacterized protein LOC114515671 isoform X1 [Dendronephthya gigantea]|uniref:uncharacterized protein LOC114515671 isoform X1 n=1 Tax=Dendronephthya gigantea TaxID=151771 RepID=UPI00106CE05C|nr:uncharacterized protein LOC114515671 isoform X1 [Dendronephthya gigantea]XP_028390769.1 uncharacterized protein LOC114515671 isoform X1 [Dendronephthya gigantea]